MSSSGVEVNNAKEMEVALRLGAQVIGVNNRNLHDFNVDMGTTSSLVDMVREKDVVFCALSGISGPQDVRVYKEQGVNAVLVGENLSDVVQNLAESLGTIDGVVSQEGVLLRESKGRFPMVGLDLDRDNDVRPRPFS